MEAKIMHFIKSWGGGILIGMLGTLAVESRTGGNSGGQLASLVGKVPLLGKLVLNQK